MSPAATGDGGERYQRPARRRPAGPTPHDRHRRRRRGHWGPARRSGRARELRTRRGREVVRRTAVIIAAGALVLLAGCNGDDEPRIGGRRRAATPPVAARIGVSSRSPTGRPTSRPSCRCRSRHRRHARARSRRRRRAAPTVRRRTGRRPTPAPRSGDRGLDAGRPLGLRHQVHAHRHREERRATRRPRRPARSPRSRRTTLSTPSIGPLDGTTVGVGMPIRVYFDDPVGDRAAVERHLKVTSSTPTDGVWNWMNDTEVHFRPSHLLAGRHRRHAGRRPLRRRPRRRRLGREEPHGLLPRRRQARLGRRRRRAHARGLRRRPARPDLPDERRQQQEPDPQRRRTSSPSPTGTSSWTRARSASPSTRPAATAPTSSTPSASRTTASSCTPRRGRSRQQGHSNVSHGCINLSTANAPLVLRLRPAGRRRRGEELGRPDAVRRPTATSTTGPSRGTSGRPAARCSARRYSDALTPLFPPRGHRAGTGVYAEEESP